MIAWFNTYANDMHLIYFGYAFAKRSIDSINSVRH